MLWIDYKIHGVPVYAWRGFSSQHFRLLSTLCRLTNETVTHAIENVGIQKLVTLDVIKEDDFNIQLNTTLNQFKQTLMINFDLLINTIQLLIQLLFNLTGPVNMETKAMDCICATDPYCQTPVVDPVDQVFTLALATSFNDVPGQVLGCFKFDSVLLSTLECYYSDSCLALSYKYINLTLYNSGADFKMVNATLLVYDPVSSRFPPNTSISAILKELMIEQWNSSFSFDRYYETCVPIKCTYSQVTRTNSFIGTVLLLMSSIGGLSAALRLITPLLIKIIVRMTRQRAPGQPKQQSQAVYGITQPQTITKIFDKPTIDDYNNLLRTYNDSLHCRCSSISLMYDHFIKIEPVYHQICSSVFTSQQWQTNITKSLVPDLSVYLIKDYRSFISSHFQFLSHLCYLATESMNDTIDQLLFSFLLTNELLSSHELDMRIELLVNQTRSSAPINFRDRLFLLRTASHATPIISTYGTNFRFIAPWLNASSSSAITYALTYDNNCSCALDMTCNTQAGFFSQNGSVFVPIKGLKMGCTPSEALLASTLECFYDSLCINLTQEYTIAANNSINIIDYSSLSINNSRFLINSTVMDLVNDIFLENWVTNISYPAYFAKCSPSSCSHSFKQQYSLIYTITLLIGLYGGLTFIFKWICPKLVVLLSKIYRYMKKRTNIVQSDLSISVTTVESTGTIQQIANVHNIVVHSDEQSTSSLQTMQFSTRTNRFFIMGIIVFVAMIIVLVIVSIYLNRLVKPVDTIFTIPSTVSTMITTSSMIISSTTPEPPCQVTFQLSSTYPNNGDGYGSSLATGDFDNNGYLDIAFVDPGPDTMGILLSNNDGSFRAQILYSFEQQADPGWIVVGDFNNDGHADLVVIHYTGYMISIFLSNGDETFQTRMTSSTTPVFGGVTAVTIDFNGDGNLDLIIGGQGLCIKFGDGTGSFSAPLVVAADIVSANMIMTGHFNDDDQLDLVVLDSYDANIKFLLNDGYGDFRLSTEFSTGQDSSPESFTLSDFNNDNRLDLAVANTDKSNIGVFLQNSNGTFSQKITYFTGTYSKPTSIVAADFNNDGQIDLIVTNQYLHNLGIYLGSGDGTFFSPAIFSTGTGSTPTDLIARDFNNDRKLDLAVVDENNNNILILFNTCTCCVDEVLQ
ncbi:unnamed protein product [Adineta steineri]|uniref:Uncharacterized protein n=1 Tax=Adineta steineri TaxID=433720 RepID=A0A818TBX8_9BILA|nr:unnamed protein product [Adineta steineri]CAF0967040.1 unnamed protein product [Adineta steineri]CAF1001268.1 unnamed protein product [Adineta steineri]CAF3679691.1 unnamed protein product [Adineta steineri]CAF3688813.1 unnamed protein product [Adineta steineri]